MREGMEVLLKGWGASVVACAAVPEAVERAAALAGPPDLIIADYRLREGGVGTEASRALRARFGSEIPAMIVSGSTTPVHLEEVGVGDHGDLLYWSVQDREPDERTDRDPAVVAPRR